MNVLSSQLNLFKAMTSSVSERINEKRNRVLLGPLPDDFLQINVSPQEQQEAADRQTAMALQQQLAGSQYIQNAAGRLSITVVQAKLTKNYGMTRMDPYCRVRVGHVIYETPTDPNGGKTPRWNKVIYCLVPQGINTINLEIFDERSFTMDELVAWAQIVIPPQVMKGETHEDWYPLNGKQGEGLEGLVNLVLSYNVYTAPYGYPAAPYPPVRVVPRVDGSGVTPLRVYTAPPEGGDVVRETLVLSEADLKQIEEMFPNIEKDVVKTVFEANRGNKDSTINSLLQMTD